MMANEVAIEEIVGFRLEETIELDHLPIISK